MEKIEAEKQALQQATMVSRLMADVMEQHEKENRRLWYAVLALIVAVVLMAGCMVYISVNGQEMMDEAVCKALNAVGEVTTTTTVTQDTGEGNGNAIYQAGENARYSEGGGE